MEYTYAMELAAPNPCTHAAGGQVHYLMGNEEQGYEWIKCDVPACGPGFDSALDHSGTQKACVRHRTWNKPGDGPGTWHGPTLPGQENPPSPQEFYSSACVEKATKLLMALPEVVDNTPEICKTCEEDEKQQQKDCDEMRKRVREALRKAGCPSSVKKSNYRKKC